MGVVVLAEVRVQLLVVVGGWVRKNKINDTLNSVEIKVEVGVELGNRVNEECMFTLKLTKLIISYFQEHNRAGKLQKIYKT